jgi:hypothetical protein
MLSGGLDGLHDHMRARTEVIGTILVIAADNPDRLKSEASFAALRGAAGGFSIRAWD